MDVSISPPWASRWPRASGSWSSSPPPGAGNPEAGGAVTGSSLAYFLFGLSLTLLLGWVIVHYYAKRRHEKVEEAKYRMLDDER